jgi:hypothetical protein
MCYCNDKKMGREESYLSKRMVKKEFSLQENTKENGQENIIKIK